MTIEEAHLRLAYLDEMWWNHGNEFQGVNLWFRKDRCEALGNLLWIMTRITAPVYKERSDLWSALWINCWHGSGYIGEYELESTDVLDCWFGEEVGPLRRRLEAIDPLIAELLDA